MSRFPKSDSFPSYVSNSCDAGDPSGDEAATTARLDDLATVTTLESVPAAHTAPGRLAARSWSMIQPRRDAPNGEHSLTRLGSAPPAPRLRPVDDQTGGQRAATVSRLPVFRAVAPVGTAQDGGAAPNAPNVPAATGHSVDAQISPATPPVPLLSLPTNAAGSQDSSSRVQSTMTRLIAIPVGSTLTSHVTYSDLPDGYEPVAREVEAIPQQRDGELVYVAKHLVQFREDPDSVAAIVASEGNNPGTFRPEVTITHHKLRYLLRDAVKWYLRKQGVRVSDAHMIFGVKDADKAKLDGVLADELKNINVDAGRLTFDAPVVLQLSQPHRDIRIIFVHALIFATVFAAVLAVMYKIGTQPHIKVVTSVVVSVYRIAVIIVGFLLRIIGHFLFPLATFMRLQAARVYHSVEDSYRFIAMQAEALLVAVREEVQALGLMML